MVRPKNTGVFPVLEFPLLRQGDGTEIERCPRVPSLNTTGLRRYPLAWLGAALRRAHGDVFGDHEVFRHRDALD